MKRKLFFILVGIAIVLKLALFAFAMTHAPESIYSPDSDAYITLGDTLYSKGAFALPQPDGSLSANVYRTPGYPLFLAVLHHFFKIPYAGVVLVQLVFSILAAFITYKTACEIDAKIAPLAALIILFDLSVTVWSMKVLTESLYLLLISVYLFWIVRYLKKGELKPMLFAGLFLAAATFVRPVSYYLGFVTALFILFANRGKKLTVSFAPILALCAITYILLGAWQIRNYGHYQTVSFATNVDANFESAGLFSVCLKKGNSALMTAGHCAYDGASSFVRILIKPGNLKYYKSPALHAVGKIAGLPIMIFLLSGFFWGCFKMCGDIGYQFMLIVFLYFSAAAVLNLAGLVGDRFRVPAMPCIAIVSAFGWQCLLSRIKSSNGSFGGK